MQLYFFNCPLAADCDSRKFNVLDGLSSGGNSSEDWIFLPFIVGLQPRFQIYHSFKGLAPLGQWKSRLSEHPLTWVDQSNPMVVDAMTNSSHTNLGKNAWPRSKMYPMPWTVLASQYCDTLKSIILLYRQHEFDFMGKSSRWITDWI